MVDNILKRRYEYYSIGGHLNYFLANIIEKAASVSMRSAELDAYNARLYDLTSDELRYIIDSKGVYGEDFPLRMEIMATYKQIQAWVKQNYGFVPETCWIADIKSQVGLPMRKAPNRKGVERVKPCPAEKVEPIRAALRYFGML